nr:type II toxin-antitoxin system VapC family toxin [Halochromatium glycolicum]
MPVKPKVYLETSVVSYLTAWRSRDLVVAGNQETTREWWERRDDFELFISQFVLEEAAAGDPGAAQRRLSVLDGIPELDITDAVERMAETLLSQVSLPPTAELDALHIAMAALGGMDYLLTWNCAHIANPALRIPINLTIQALGYEPPIICTPLELLEV